MMTFRLIRDIRFWALSCFFLMMVQCQEDPIIENPDPDPDPPIVEEVIDSMRVILNVDSCVLIPIGQLLQTGNSVGITIEGISYAYEILDDGLGGFWAVIPYEAFQDNSRSNLDMTFIRRYSPIHLFELSNDSTSAYLKSSNLINWNYYPIILRAQEICDASKTTTENAKAIQFFVGSHLSFDDTYSFYYGGFTAERTYIDEKGVCINFSRLFVALCRAAGIPARSVSGVIFLHGEPGTDCFFHHQWCEFLDENDHWRSLDLTYTKNWDIIDIEYIGFTYCSEETEIFAENYSDYIADPGRPFKTGNEVLVYYAYLPTHQGARFNYELLTNHYPDSLVFNKSISVLKRDGVVLLN